MKGVYHKATCVMETTTVVITVMNDPVQVRHKPSINKEYYITSKYIHKKHNNEILNNNVTSHIIATGYSYTELSKTHCRGDEYHTFSTVPDAEDACSADTGCQAVYDAGCDAGANDIHLCPKGVDFQDSESSCVYQKRKFI